VILISKTRVANPELCGLVCYKEANECSACGGRMYEHKRLCGPVVRVPFCRERWPSVLAVVRWYRCYI
jgi:hypothetical protein